LGPKFAKYRGRVVNNTGDGFLAEFQSVIAAGALLRSGHFPRRTKNWL
jgi:class 3 adenylate cyclase